jgi:hypothetical protein
MLKIVQIKLMAPKMEEAPERCRLNTAQSTATFECAAMWIKADTPSSRYLLLLQLTPTQSTTKVTVEGASTQNRLLA